MYPDQSLYPSNSVPTLVKRINSTAAGRPDRVRGGRISLDWFAPSSPTRKLDSEAR